MWGLTPASEHNADGIRENLGEIYIVDALPAPPDSVHSATHFDRGIEGMPERLRDIRNRTADIVSYIGEWHSHPAGHGAGQSLDDRIQAAVLAFGMAADGLAFLQLIVGEDAYPRVGKDPINGKATVNHQLYRAQPVPLDWVPEGTPHSETALRTASFADGAAR